MDFQLRIAVDRAIREDDVAGFSALMEQAPVILNDSLEQLIQCPWSDGPLLHKAALLKAAGVTRWLVQHGAPLDLLNAKEETPLSVAAQGHDHHDMIRVLVEMGADPNGRPGSHPPLHRLSESFCSYSEADVRLLLQHGADVELRDRYNFTPLMSAAQAGRPQNVSLLLQAGADVSATGGRRAQPETALEMAERYKKLRTAALIRSWIQTKRAFQVIEETSLSEESYRNTGLRPLEC